MSAQSRKTGMNTRAQSLLIGNSNEKRCEQISLLRAERPEERVLVLAPDAADRFHHVASCFREVQCIAAPVGRLRAALNHAVLFELVDQHDESAGQDAEVFRE